MSIILAAAIWFVTACFAVTAWCANSMSDAPGRPGVPIWPIILIGGGLGAALFASHWLGW